MATNWYRDLEVHMPTKHGKGRLIQQVFEPSLNWTVEELPFDTDTLGTFSGEVERPAEPWQTAVWKMERARAQNNCRFMVASEGSFYPHPEAPFVTLNTELVVFCDFENGRTFTGRHTSLFHPAGKLQTGSWEQAKSWIAKMDFPDHGLLVMTTDPIVSLRLIVKNCSTWEALQAAFEACKQRDKHQQVLLESDFRAMRNPSRQQNILKAAANLLEVLSTPCPECGEPGFEAYDIVTGLACSWCGTPTRLPKGRKYRCTQCTCEAVIETAENLADPGYCDVCNP